MTLFEREDVMNLEQLCLKVPSKYSALQYLGADEHVPHFDELID